MQKSREHIRHRLLYDYQLHHSAREASRNICEAIGQGSISNVAASKWFNRFNNQDYDLSDDTRSGRPLEIDIDKLQALIKSDPRQTTRCLANEIGCDHSAIEYHLTQISPFVRSYGPTCPA